MPPAWPALMTPALPALDPRATTLAGPTLALFYGHPQTTRLMHGFLVRPLGRGETILVLDAANGFDAFWVARLARRHGKNPRDYLQRIRVSRAFTCYQLAELLERVPAAVRRHRASLILVTGLPDIFYDEEIPAAKTAAVFVRAARSLLALRRWRCPVVVFSNQLPVPPSARLRLLEPLQQQAAYVGKLVEDEQGLRCLCEKAAASLPA